jgi:hypothetical protein
MRAGRGMSLADYGEVPPAKYTGYRPYLSPSPFFFRYTKLSRSSAFVLLASLFAALIPAGAFAAAGPGSGMLEFYAANAAYRDSVPVNTSNKWTIKLTAVEPFSNGRIVFEIPPDWTPPQDDGSFAAGFVTVQETNEAITTATIVDITGQLVEVHVDSIPSTEGVLLVYGNDLGGSQMVANAKSPSTPRTSVFRIYTHSNSQVDPTAEVGNSWPLEVVPDVPVALQIEPDNGTVEAGTPVTYTVYFKDTYGNRTWLDQPATFDLTASEGAFHASYPGPIITDILVPAFVDSFQFDYYSEVATGGAPHTITVENTVLSLMETTTINVDPLPEIEMVVFTTGPFTFTTASEGGPYVLQTQDGLGNPLPVPSNQQINLISSSTGGSFSAQGGSNFTPVTSVTIPSGQSSVQFYYRDTKTGNPTITATAAGQPTWSFATQPQTVDPGPPARFDVSPANADVDVGAITEYTILVVDAYDNRTSLTEAKGVLLQPPVGDFYEPGNYGSPISQPVAMSPGEDELRVDFRSYFAGYGLIVILTDDFKLFGATNVTVNAGSIPDAAVSTVSATTNIVASGLDSSVVTVTVKDQFGNGISGVSVDISATNGANAIDPVAATDINGEATGYVTHTVAQVVTVSADAGGIPITQTAQVLFVAGDVDADNSTIAGNSPVTADGVATSTLTATALDAHDNPIEGASVTFSVSPPGGGAILMQPSGLTNALGQASGTLSSTSAGARVVKAVIDGAGITDSLEVSFDAGPVDLDVSTVAATSPVTANGTSQSTVTVTVTDAQGNPIQNVNVVIGAGGSATVPLPGGLTNAAGQAFGAVRNTKAETVNVFATAGGSALTDTAQVTFVAGGVNAGTSLVAASPGSVVANGSSFSTITVTARDAQSNPVPGKTVALSVAPNDGIVVLNPTNGVTGTDGTMTATILSTKTQSYQVSAVVDGVPVIATAGVTFTPGPIASFVWTVPGAATAGQPVAVTISAFDAQGNPKTDYVGAVSLTTNGTGNITWGVGSGSGIMVDGDPAVYTFALADNGSATIAVTNERKETFRLFANDGGASGTSADIVVDNAIAANITIVAGGVQTATVFTDVATSPKIRVTDAFGNRVDGEPVTFRLLAAQDFGSIDVNTGGGGPVDSTGVTDAAGELVCQRWTLGQTAGTNRLQARVQGGALTANFTAEGTPGPGANIDISPTNQPITINASMDVLATLADSYGNPVPGEQVTIFIKDPADGMLSQSAGHTTTFISATARSGITDANGQTSVSYDAPSTSGVSDNVDASSLPNVSDGSVVDRVYTTVTTGATNLRITFVSGSSARAGESFQMLVEAVDGFGNRDATKTNTVDITPEAGAGLEFSLTDFGAAITQFDLAAGARTVYGRGTTVKSTGDGTWDITMSTAGLGSAVEPFTITDADVVDHYLVVAPAGVTSGTNFEVTVVAQDVFDNRVMSAGNSVDLAAVSPADSSVLADPLLVPQVTLVNGSVTFAEQYPKAVTMLIRARDGSGNEGFSAPVSVSTSAAYQIVKISGDASGVVAGTQQPLVAEVQDENDNPVSGAAVTFVITEGGGVLPAQPVTTGFDGRVTVPFTTGPNVGDNAVKATILDGSPESRERIDFLVSTVAGAIDTLIVMVDRTSMIAGETVNVEIDALDENDNLVSYDNTTMIDLYASASAATAVASGQLSGGTFATTVTDTAVEFFRVFAQMQVDDPYGVSDSVSVGNAAAYEIIQVTPDESGVVVGDSRVLEADVRDIYGNAVPNEFVRYVLVPQGGPGGTARLSNNGIAQTDAAGRAADSLYTAYTAGANVVDATIGDGPPPDREGVTFTITTAAGLISYYAVDTDVSQQTAGQPVNVTVRAYDASDNLVEGDNATPVNLLLDPGSGPMWGDIMPVTLEAGTLQTTLVVDNVQTYRVRAETDGDPLTTGLSDPVAIVPDVPAGVVTLTPSKPTITANGTSTTTITSGVITDQFGNRIPQGALITVATAQGEIASPDQDEGIPDNQQAVRADGMIRFVVRSDAVYTGPVDVTINSVNGTANGLVNITFAPPPAIATASAPDPNSVIIGLGAQFRIPVENTASTYVILSTLTRFEFTDGTRTFSAPLAAPDTIFGNSVDTLLFASTTVPSNMTPARYQPLVKLSGADEFGSAYTMTSLLPVQSLLVSSIEITGISARDINGPISQGTTDTLQVTVNNPTPDVVIIETASPVFKDVTGGIKSYIDVASLNLPLSIPGNSPGIVRIAVTVGSSSLTGVDEIDATVTGTVGGKAVTDNSLAPYPLPTWEIVTARDINYAAGTLAPTTVSLDKTYQMSVRLRNDGSATVSIDSAGTSLSFTDGVSTYSAKLAGLIAIPGGASQLLTFKPRTVPAAMTVGNDRDVMIVVAGMESGLPFVDTLYTSSEGDGVDVVSGANVVYTGSLNPMTVSKGTSVAFSVQVQNTGGATVELQPNQTRFRFGGVAYEAFLDDHFTTTLTPGFHTLHFQFGEVRAFFAPGGYTPAIDLVGTENGLDFSQTFPVADQVIVQEAPDINITRTRPSQVTFTQDQSRPIDVWMTVVNSGGSTVSLDSTRIRFILGGADRTGQFEITSPTQFFNGGAGSATLAGGATDSLHFAVTDNFANAMSDGVMTIEGRLWVTDNNPPVTQIFANTDLGGKGSLVVQTPALLAVQSVTSTQDPVTVSQTSPAFQLKMVVSNQGQSDARLSLTSDSTLVTFSPAGGWVPTTQGTLAGGGVILPGGETDTVVVDVIRAGSTPGTIQLGGQVRGEELNSGDFVQGFKSNAGTIDVQTDAVLTVTDVRTTRPKVTAGSDVLWNIEVDIRNDGQASMDLTLPNSIAVTIADQTLPSTFSLPATMEGKGTFLAGSETGTLVIGVTQTGQFLTFGPKQISVQLSGIELNRDESVDGSGNGTVTVQGPADPSYVISSLQPNVVSKGSSESFRLSIQNQLPTGATMRLDRAQTRLRFGNSAFDAGLAATSPDSIPGGETVQLVFENKAVSTQMDSAGTVSVQLTWEENGADSARTIDLPDGELTVQNAGQLQIVSITTTQASVTQGQARDWFVDMVVRNNGQANVRLTLTLDPDSTWFQFEPLVGLPVTGEYGTLAYESGDPLIPGSGAERTYRYRVPQGGTTTGPIKISATVRGYDLTSLLPVDDTTIDGGSGGFELQTPADIRIVSITPDQLTATHDQTREYFVEIGVENAGESAVKLGLNPDSTALTFSLNPGWLYTLQPTLVEGGSILRDGQSGTVLATVTNTGSTVGSTDISARIDGVEINSGRFEQGFGNNLGVIDVQNPAVLSISSVDLSRPSVTENSIANWTISVQVANTGEADAVFVKDSASVFIQDELTGTNLTIPSTFVSERTSLPGGGSPETLLIDVDDTGSFTSLGTKTITVRLVAEEDNSGAYPAVTDNSASIAIQSAPALVYKAGSLDPPAVSQGASVGFQLIVQNPGPDAATARLAPTTEFTISGQPYLVNLTAADSIPGDDEKTLTFNTAPVDVNNGKYGVDVSANYSHNGNTVSDRAVPVSDSVTVQTPPDLSIVSIVPSQPTVTANQSRRWFLRMVVQNNGETPIELDLSEAVTKIFMDHVLVGDVTGDYTILGPTQLQVAGSDTLVGGETDTLLFTVDTDGTGSIVGGINVEGIVAGKDVSTDDPLSDDTRISGGGGYVVVQSPGALVVNRISTGQPTVTQGQTTAWESRVVVKNNGGSDLVFSDPASSVLTLQGTGWGDPNLTDHPDTLRASEVDSLVYEISGTTETVGPASINALVVAKEINSGDDRTFNTGSQGGSGSIVVQSRPNLRFITASTRLIAPNAANSRVNTDQDFEIAVEIENAGQAGANQVQYRIDGGSAGQPLQSTRTIASLPGGTTVVDTFEVTAVSAPAEDDISAALLDSTATDVNSTETIVLTDPDSVVADSIIVQAPAILVVDSVAASQHAVTMQQTTDWYVRAYVSNSGEADLRLTEPSATDLSFLIGPVQQTGYAVIAPDTLASGRPGWIIHGGDSDSLIYTVDVTGSNTGWITARATIGATDVNDTTLTPSMSGEDSVLVEARSDLFVERTEIKGLNYSSGSVWYVNTSDTFTVEIDVRNRGSAVKDVKVSVSSDFSTPAPDTIVVVDTHSRIDTNSVKTFVFKVVAQPISVPPQTLTASIDEAFSVNTGEAVTPGLAVDATENFAVQTPARLSLESFLITSPESAQDNTLSTDQVFYVTARVTNEGEAGIGSGGQVTVTPPGGFDLNDAADRPLVLDNDIVWQLTAPSVPRTLDTLVCEISSIPLDRNNQETALTNVASDTIMVTVLEGGDVPVEQPVVTGPSGATDNIVSTDQTFKVAFTATPKAAHVDLTAAIELPAGFQAVGQSTIDLQDGDGTAQSDTFTVQASSVAGGGDISVTVSGTDQNTSEPVEGTSLPLVVTAVAKAELSITAAIAGPSEAQDSTVTIGSTFQLQAIVTNLGTALIDTLSNPTVRIYPPSGYTANTTPRLFRVGEPVIWNVVAPGVPSGPDAFTLRIENIPLDENSGMPAAVDMRQQTIPIVTEGASVAMSDVTEAQDIDNKVVPDGTGDVDKFAFSLQYQASDPSANDVRVDTVRVSILDEHGSLLSGANIGRTLSSVYIRIDGDRGETSNPQTNPVVVDLSGASSSVIAPDGTVTLTLGVDVKKNPSASQFKLALQGQQSIVVKDTGSPQRLGVVDAESGRPIGDQFQSSLLVVLSSAFEEYVHNYPNPFRAGTEETNITYFLNSPGDVSIKIYDLLGNLVYDFENDNVPTSEGTHEVEWWGKNNQGEVVRNGVYVCVLSAGGQTAKFRIAVAK